LQRQSAQRKYLKALRYVRMLWAIVIVLLFILSIEVVLAMCFSPRFWIYRVVVQGNETIAVDDVLHLLHLPAKSNYYRAPLRELATRVQREPCLRQVIVRRLGVGVLGVDIFERIPVCRLGHTLPLTYLDADGYLYTRPFPPNTPVPIIEGVTVPADAKLGKPLHNSAITGILACLTALREKHQNDQELLADLLVMTPQEQLILVLRENTRVYLGTADDLLRKIWVVRHTIKEAQAQGYSLSNIQYIDAKVIERVPNANDNNDPEHTTSLGAVFKPRVENGQKDTH